MFFEGKGKQKISSSKEEKPEASYTYLEKNEIESRILVSRIAQPCRQG